MTPPPRAPAEQTVTAREAGGRDEHDTRELSGQIIARPAHTAHQTVGTGRP